MSIPLFASAARTATPSPASLSLGDARAQGLIVVINVTAITATPSVVFKVQGVDGVSGATWDIIASAAVTAVGTTVLKIRPGITPAANAAVSDAIPRDGVQVIATHGDADSITYSVTAYPTH